MDIDLVNWDKLPAQEIFFDDDTSKINMISAGLGSGKTHVLCRKMLKLSALNRGHPGAIMAPTFTDFRRDIKPEMEKILSQELNLRHGVHWWYHGQYNEYRFVWNKYPLYVLSGENSIAGPNLAYCGINEYSLIKWERIQEMLRRVRVKEAPYRQRCMVGTPEDKFAWLEDFVELQKKEEEKKPGSFKLTFADTRENVHVDPEYRAHLEAMLDSQSLRVFASGEIVRIGGNYFYYTFTRERNVTDHWDHDPNLIVYANLDFNVGKMSTTFCHKIGNHSHYFDELYLEGDSDTQKMGEAIAVRFGTNNIVLTLDASAKNRKTSGMSDVQILQKLGFKNIRFKRHNPRFRERQLLICGRLERGLILFHPRMKRTIKDMAKVMQLNNFEKDKSNLDLTHFSDTVDYYEDYEYSLNLGRKSRTIEL